MARNEFPLIQGDYASWAQLGVALDIKGGSTVMTKDFSAVDWEDNVETAPVPGTGPEPIGSVTGAYTTAGSMSMYLDRFCAFQDALAAKNSRIALVRFSIFLAWVPLDGDGVMKKCSLIGCKIMGRGNTNAPGTDATTITVPLYIQRAELNGRRLI